MRSLLAITLVLAAALFAGSFANTSRSDAARSLTKSTALRYANRAATNRDKRTPAIVDWEIVRGFRFDSRKWVFVWSAQMKDGRICGAQLVTRYASSTSSKVIAYFRNEECS